MNMCKVMGIVNVTPDSFSDGGKYNTPEEAVRRARNLVEEGAAIIDVGGESTRPGATPLSWEEEWSRIEPVLAGLDSLLSAFDFQISVDTYHPETAERAVAAGATIVNCVYSEPVPAMAAICARTGAELVLPFRPGDDPASLPMDISRIYLDPMVGFGTTREEDVALLGSLRRLAARGPVLVGVSRKRVIGTLSGEAEPARRLGGSVGAAVWCAMCGASVVRVHDVKETKEALAVVGALAQQEGGAPWNGIK